LQALKSGQLPADIKGLNDNIVLDNVDEKPEDMIHNDGGQADGESNGTQEQTNTDSTSMEQVYVLFDVFVTFILYICYSSLIIIPP